MEEKGLEKAALARKYLERTASRSPNDDPIDQLFNTVLRKGVGIDPAQVSPVVNAVANNLQKEEEVEGRLISPFSALTSPDLSFSAKTSWFENRFLPRYEFLRNQARPEETEQIPQSLSEPTESPQTPNEPTPPPTPSPTKDEYEQHGGREEKGKGAPIFVINPSFTGYWEEDSYDSIDEQIGRLVKSPTQRIRTAISQVPTSIIESSKRTISGNSGDVLFNLPLSPGFQITQAGLDTLRSQGIEAFGDTEGHVFIQPSLNLPIQVEIARSSGLPNSGIHSRDEAIFEQNLPSEISTELDRIRNLTTDSIGKIQEWKDFMQKFFKYPSDDQVQSMYSTVDNSTSRLQAMISEKMLDCYLAREFFVAGLKRLNLIGIEWRLVNGHFVASAQKDGTAQIHFLEFMLVVRSE